MEIKNLHHKKRHVEFSFHYSIKSINIIFILFIQRWGEYDRITTSKVLKFERVKHNYERNRKQTARILYIHYAKT